MTPDYLPIAVRAFTVSKGAKQPGPRFPAPPKYPPGVLALDTETTVDETQRLIFGFFQRLRWDENGILMCRDDGLFYADDLQTRDPATFEQLRIYAETHRSIAPNRRGQPLRFLSRREFLDRVFYPAAYRARCLVVGFNLPFDLSRLALRASEARGRHRGGFSLGLFETRNADGTYRENGFRPRIVIQSQDSKRSFIHFTRVHRPDLHDTIPPGAPDGAPDPTYRWRGRFLDLRTEVFALTGKSHTLRSAGEALGATVLKRRAPHHGSITPEYLDYARGDVDATVSLLLAARREFDRHPVDLLPDRAYSPAALAKAYLRALGITPLATRSDLSLDQIGATMSAYFGGRAEVRIRRALVPIRYVDFLSMYPTVNVLMRLWPFLTAERIEATEATDDARQLLAGVTLDACFDKSLWPQLTFFALVQPDGDILPVRAQYGAGGAYTIGVNPLIAPFPLWYSGPDLVASTLLTGRAPKIIKAFRLTPVGVLPGLAPVRLRGSIEIDSRTTDLFRAVIEERKRPHARAEDDAFLKMLANSGSYGIFAEMIRQMLAQGATRPVTVYGPDAPFECSCAAPEEPGSFCYPPIAAVITGAARLMLTLLECSVRALGGHYAFCDTDSMAIVATRDGGLVETAEGESIQALSWPQVDAIVARFAGLNPYDPTVVPGSILKYEKEAVDELGARAETWCLAISAKRYCIFTRDRGGVPHLVNDGFTEHALGAFLDPTKEGDESEDTASEKPPSWIAGVWDGIARHTALGESGRVSTWAARPAVVRLSITKPALLRPFAAHNRGKPYDDQVKPFNFLLSVLTRAFGHPAGADKLRFHLIAPFTKDARRWRRMPWTDRYSGTRHPIAAGLEPGDARPEVAGVKSYADVIDEYAFHPEAKSAGADGQPCGRQTMGLLRRRTIYATELDLIGKESNSLDEVDAHVVHDWDEVRNVYARNRPPVLDHALRIMATVPQSEASRLTGLSKRTLRRLQHHPPRRHRRGTSAALYRGGARIATAAVPDYSGLGDRPVCMLFAARPPSKAKPLCAQCSAPVRSGNSTYCGSRCRQRAYRHRRPVDLDTP